MTPDERRHAMIAAARACKGTPWQHQGRLPGVGLDCLGLIVHAAKAGGVYHDIHAQETPNYGRWPHKNGLFRFFERHLVRVKPPDLRGGDIALLCMRSHPQHVGLISNHDGHDLAKPDGIIHSAVHLGAVVEHRWGPGIYQVHSYWRFRETV